LQTGKNKASAIVPDCFKIPLTSTAAPLAADDATTSPSPKKLLIKFLKNAEHPPSPVQSAPQSLVPD
jgi:hypothetical protein